MAEDDVLTTDEEILDSIGEGEVDGDVGQEEEASTAAQDVITKAQSTDSDKGADGSNGEDKGARQAPGPQDLLDRDGQVLARGGPERRFYETALKEKQRANELQTKVGTLTSQIDAINSAGTIGTQYDLTPEEVVSGAQIMSAYKENPVGTIKYLLTQAQAAGHNIEDISSGGFDAKALKEMIDTALKPLTDDRQARVDTQEADAAGLEAYNDFMGKHPDAHIHQDTLAKLLASDPSLTPDAAFYKLQAFFAQRGLDWQHSLDQHQVSLDAKNAEGSDGDGQVQLPGGGTNPTTITDTAGVADVNVSTDNIIRDAMAEAGIK
jgi:hypothetical protein